MLDDTTRILNDNMFSITMLLAETALVITLASLSADVFAATSNPVAPTLSPVVPLATTPPFPPRRAPLAPPAINDVSRAYDFRTRLSGNPSCQRFAAESDAVFLSNTLDDTQKEEKLKALGAEAKASGCVAPVAD